jgi:hypothetical protein
MQYTAGLLISYYRLLMKCRRWMREGRAAVPVAQR